MADKKILGDGLSSSMDYEKSGANGNTVVAGSTGSGKTMSYVVPYLLETTEHSIIVPVSKRKLIDIFAPLFKERGYRVGIMDFVNPQNSILSFDLMSGIHNRQDILSMADYVVKSSGADHEKGNHSDPYWDNSAVSLLSALIFLAIKTIKNPTFLDVYNLFYRLHISGSEDEIKTALDSKFEQLADDPENFYGLSWWADFRELPMRTARCVYSSLATPLNYMFTPELLEMIKSKPSIDFKEIAQTKTALFVYTSAVKPVLNHYVKLFYSEAIKDLFEYAESLPEGKLPIPVDIICDDFANGGRIQNFPEYISIFREKGISVTAIIQSESQLSGMYGETGATTILNNCDTYIYMGGTDVDTVESVSKRANVPFEDIYCMPLGQIYVFRRGQKPVRTWRYKVKEDPRYQEAMKKYQQSTAERYNAQSESC